MEFNSQICTTKEQSERLMTLGLKAETADMSILTNRIDCDGIRYSLTPYKEMIYPKVFGAIPAWSLHRLIEMCNNTQVGMTIGIYYDEVSVDGDLFEVYDNTYDNLISIIEWLIELDNFNKEYLEE